MTAKNILIVYAHPEPKSINGALMEHATQSLRRAGHTVAVSDLYDMAFNATSDRTNFLTQKDPHYFKQQLEELYATEVNGFAAAIEQEIQKVERCDLMIWQFPLWWFSVPAILKGWVDRVFAMGRTYGHGRFYEHGIFQGKKAMLSLTTGGGIDAYVDGGLQGDMMGILRPIHRGMLQFTGFTVLAPHIVYAPARRSKEDLQRELAEFEARLLRVWDEQPVDVGMY